jgi:phenylalanyl-tRNA synthetase beta chain
MRVGGISFGAADRLQWGRSEQATDFFDMKGDVEALLAPLSVQFEASQHPALHPGRCASVRVAGQAIGFIGELHPQWRQAYDLAQAPMLFELELDAVLQRPVPVFAPVAKFQAVERDIAVIVAEVVGHGALLAATQAAATDGLLRDAVVFDIYRPKPIPKGAEPTAGGLVQGEKSVALRLTLNSLEATLTESQIESAVQAVLAQLGTQCGARLRA